MRPSEQIANTQTESYEPPRVERVMTAEDFEREVLYAGVVITLDQATG